MRKHTLEGGNRYETAHSMLHVVQKMIDGHKHVALYGSFLKAFHPMDLTLFSEAKACKRWPQIEIRVLPPLNAFLCHRFHISYKESQSWKCRSHPWMRHHLHQDSRAELSLPPSPEPQVSGSSDSFITLWGAVPCSLDCGIHERPRLSTQLILSFLKSYLNTAWHSSSFHHLRLTIEPRHVGLTAFSISENKINMLKRGETSETEHRVQIKVLAEKLCMQVKWRCSRLQEKKSLGQEQGCGDTWHPCQVFLESVLQIGLWKILFMSDENALREIWVLEIHLQLMQGLGFLWENPCVKTRLVVVLMGNSKQQLSFHSATWKEKDMIWHLLHFRTWECKTQTVLLAKICKVLKAYLNAICNWFTIRL